MTVPPSGVTTTTTRRLQEDPSTACEDLKFFEKRLTEVITHMGPPCTRWRISVAIVIFAVVIGVTGSKYLANEMDSLFGIFSLRTPFTRTVPVTWLDMLITTHLDFTICVIVGLVLFGCFGVHRRIVAPTIVARRCRDALSPFSLSCDHNGKLIVKKAVRNQPQ